MEASAKISLKELEKISKIHKEFKKLRDSKHEAKITNVFFNIIKNEEIEIFNSEKIAKTKSNAVITNGVVMHCFEIQIENLEKESFDFSIDEAFFEKIQTLIEKRITGIYFNIYIYKKFDEIKIKNEEFGIEFNQYKRHPLLYDSLLVSYDEKIEKLVPLKILNSFIVNTKSILKSVKYSFDKIKEVYGKTESCYRVHNIFAIISEKEDLSIYLNTKDIVKEKLLTDKNRTHIEENSCLYYKTDVVKKVLEQYDEEQIEFKIYYNKNCHKSILVIIGKDKFSMISNFLKIKN